MHSGERVWCPVNAAVTPALLSALAQAYASRREQESILFGLLEGLVIHSGKTFPLLTAADLERLCDAGILERRGNKMGLRKDGSASRSFTDQLCEAYKEATGQQYLFSARDGVSLAQLQRTANREEILRRWRLGLASTGWLQTATIGQLLLKWNDLAMQNGRPTGADIKEGDVF